MGLGDSGGPPQAFSSLLIARFPCTQAVILGEQEATCQAPSRAGPGSQRRKEAHNCGERPLPPQKPLFKFGHLGPARLPPGPWKPAQSALVFKLARMSGRSSGRPVSPGPGAKARVSGGETQAVSKTLEYMSLGGGCCREVGAFSSSVFIFIKTKIGSRQCISNRDEKRKRKGLWEVKLRIQLQPVSMGTGAALCGWSSSPSPRLASASVPGTASVRPTFLSPSSSAAPPTPPPGPSPAATSIHCRRSGREVGAQHLGYSEPRGRSAPGRWEPACCPRTTPASLLLPASFSVSSSSRP